MCYNLQIHWVFKEIWLRITDSSKNDIYYVRRETETQRSREDFSQTTRTHSDWIGVPDEFVDVEGLSVQLPRVMLQDEPFPSTAVQSEGRPVSFSWVGIRKLVWAALYQL